jgi:hypothetical protein
MTKTSTLKVTVASLALGLVATFAPSLSVASQSADMNGFTYSTLTLPIAEFSGYEIARRGRGADDGAGHTRGGGKGRGRGADDAPDHGWMPVEDGIDFARRGRGADDGTGHTRGGGRGRGRGADDAPNHG